MPKKSKIESAQKSIESWIWDAACSIRGAKDAPKYKDYILPLIFTKRLGLDDVEADIIGKEEEKLSRIVDHAELKKNDYNISPSRYIHTGDADLSAVALAKEETYRPIGEIVAELDAIESDASETDKALREILKQIGV